MRYYIPKYLRRVTKGIIKIRKSKKDSSISVRFKSHFRRIVQGNRAIVHAWPEVTSPEVTAPEICAAHARLFPALFSYYSSSTKCTIAHDRHGYWMWRDRKWSVDVTRSDVIKPEVGIPALFSRVFGYFRGFWLCCVVLLGCFLSRPPKWPHRKYVLRNPGFFPRFFLTIVVGQNIRLRMTDMATGCDVTESHVTWSGDFPSFLLVLSDIFEVFTYGLCCVVLQGCILSRPRSHCGISTK